MARATVHDLAVEAKVSLATIDRVLNKRGNVRPATVAKVEQAMKRLNFQRDPAAITLARQRQYNIIFMIPSGANSFMRNLAAEVAHLGGLYRGGRISIRLEEFPVFDGVALAEKLNAIEAGETTGVAVVATDSVVVRQAIDRLVERGVQVVTLVSDVPGSRRARFIGIDNSAAGRTAASLMGKFLHGRSGAVAILAGSMLLRDHAERHYGCLQVLRTEYPDLRPLPVVEGRDDDAVAERVLGEVLDADPGIIGVYSLGAGNRGVIAALKQRNLCRLTVVAHELTDHSRQALLDETFDAVLNQDPGHEIRSADRILRALIDGQPYNEAQERIKIDIYLRDNM